MLGWVITCHDDKAEELLSLLEKTRPAGAMPGGEFLAWIEREHAESDDVRRITCYGFR